MRVEANTIVSRIGQSVERRDAELDRAPPSAAQKLRDGIRVTLSEQGRAASQAARNNDDIDESDLPDTIKDLLKRIRELKAQLAERQAELRAVMTDGSLDDEARQIKADALRTEIASLSGALTGANAQLIKAMREQGLSNEQLQRVATLSV
jgi:Sec-independent protein translocase protein TatA